MTKYNDIEIIDKSNDKKHYTQIPNYILDHSTHWDREVYIQMKRITGDTGSCWASRDTLAKQCGMSLNRFKKSIEYLIKHKWIHYSGKKKCNTKGGVQELNTYTITDIWAKNNAFYQDKGGSPDDRPNDQRGVMTDAKGGSSHDKRGVMTNSKGGSPEDLYKEPVDNKNQDNNNQVNKNINQSKDSGIKNSKISGIYKLYSEKINSKARLTDSSKKKIETRLDEYSPEDLKKAILNFSNASWWMQNNAHRGIAWFFHTEDRIDQFLNLKETKDCSKAPKYSEYDEGMIDIK